MVRRSKIVYECDQCRKTLETQKDGLIFHGYVVAPNGDAAKPLIGPAPGLRDTALSETALCWSCIRKVATDPELESRRLSDYKDYLDNPDPDAGGISGPLPPPELPHGVMTAQALCGVRRR
jgi:hypothetical protein